MTEEFDESLDVYDAADIWLSNGMDEDYTFGYSEEELRRALEDQFIQYKGYTMSKEIFNSKETLLAAGEIITISEKIAQGKLTKITEIEDEKIRELIENGIKYSKSNADKIGGALGATAGGGLGVVSGFGLITLMAAEGTAGAAVVTSGLAGIGAVFGGGMLAGLGTILVIPAALAAVGGIVGLILSSKNKVSRNEAKKELLSEAARILIDLKIKVQEVNSEFVLGALLTLKALINDLNRDLENQNKAVVIVGHLPAVSRRGESVSDGIVETLGSTISHETEGLLASAPPK